MSPVVIFNGTRARCHVQHHLVSRGVHGERRGTTAGVALLEGGGIFLAALLHRPTHCCFSLLLSFFPSLSFFLSLSVCLSVCLSLSLALSPFRLLQRSARRTMIASPVVTALLSLSELIIPFSRQQVNLICVYPRNFNQQYFASVASALFVPPPARIGQQRV